MNAGARVDHHVGDGEKLLAPAKTVQRPDLDQAFQHAPVDLAQVDALAKVVEAGKGPALLAGADDLCYCACADVLDRAHAKTDRAVAQGAHGLGTRLAAGLGDAVLDGKVEVAGVDVGRQDGDAQAAALGQEHGHLVRVVALDGQQGGHVLDRVLGLEVGRLAGDHGIVGGVGLVKAIVGKVLDGRIDLVGLVGGHAVGHAPLAELDPVLGDLLFVFFRDGAADHVGLPARIAGQVAHDANDLLLVDDHPIGLLQDRLQGGVNVLDRFFTVLALAIGLDKLHRPGAIERDDGGNVVQAGGAHLGQRLFHALALDLENAHHLAVGQQVKDAALVGGDGLQVQADAVPRLDPLGRLAHLGQGGQAQKVELEQTDALDDRHGELGDGHVRVALGGAGQGDIVDQRLVGDDDAGGVHAGVARDALHLAGHVDPLADIVLRLIEGLELGVLESVLEVHLGAAGHHLGHAVDLVQGHVERAAHVAHRRAAAQGPKSDNVGHLVDAVLGQRVLDHLGPAVVGIVQVDVGHGHPLGVEKALKDEVVLQGIDARDAERIGDHRTGARPAHVPPDVPFDGKLAQVPQDQEIGVKAHVVDHAQLIVQALPQGLVGVGIALPEPGLGQLAQIACRIVARGHVKDGQVIALALDVHLAPLGDAQGVFQRVGPLGKEGRHLVLALDIVAVVGHAHAVRVGAHLARLDAEQDVLRLGVLGPAIVRVVGGHQGEVELAGQGHQPPVQRFGLGDALVVLHLDVKVVRAERVAIPQRGGARAVRVAVQQVVGHLARVARGQGDQPLGVRGEKGLVHARLVIKALQLRGGGDAHQVAVPGLVFGQQDQVVGGLVLLRVAVGHATRRDIDLQAGDRLDALRLAGADKIDHAKHDAVIGQGDGRHAQLGGAPGQVFDPAQAVKQRELAVDVQMDKPGHEPRSWIGGKQLFYMEIIAPNGAQAKGSG